MYVENPHKRMRFIAICIISKRKEACTNGRQFADISKSMFYKVRNNRLLYFFSPKGAIGNI